MYVNAWLKQPSTAWPGRYPSGGPLPQVIDVWRAAAPSIDFIAPDIYIDEFAWICREYTRSGNPLFIPETRGGAIGAARSFYAFGEYSAGCFAPFGIDNELYLKNDPLDETYAVLNNMKSVILDNQGKGDMRGILLDSVCPSKTIEMGEYSIKANLAEGKKPGIAGVLIIQTDKREFIVAGKGLDLFFIPRDTSMRVALDLVDEGSFKNGSWVSERRLNGDETISRGSYQVCGYSIETCLEDCCRLNKRRPPSCFGREASANGLYCLILSKFLVIECDFSCKTSAKFQCIP